MDGWMESFFYRVIRHNLIEFCFLVHYTVRSKVSHAFRDGERRALLQRERNGLLVDSSMKEQEAHMHVHAQQGKVGSLSTTPTENVEIDVSQSDSESLSAAVSSGRDQLLSYATILTSMGQSSHDAQPQQQGDPMETLSTMATSSLPPVDQSRQKAKKAVPRKVDNDVKIPNPTDVNAAGHKTEQIPSPISTSLQKYCEKADVVFGRGAPLRQHPGNVAFRKTVAKFSQQYLDGAKHIKTEIIQNVIRELQDAGARFLIMNDEGSGVMEASIAEIRMKVSHRFRDFPKK